MSYILNITIIEKKLTSIMEQWLSNELVYCIVKYNIKR